MSRLGCAIPALPARDVSAAATFYRERLGFEVLHREHGLAVLERDEARLHLWQAADESWRGRAPGDAPVRSGAESFIAGTASCRIEVDGVEELYEELRSRGVLHPVSGAGLEETNFGSREFSCLDEDGNLITFFAWTAM